MKYRNKRWILGRWGEWLASFWLRLHGYGIQKRNWRCKVGELDIVAVSAAELLFVEVKTRWRCRGFRPADAVTRSKRKRIVRAARVFMKRHPQLGPHRTVEFSIVEVVITPWPRITVLRDAFRGSEGTLLSRAGRWGRNKSRSSFR